MSRWRGSDLAGCTPDAPPPAPAITGVTPRATPGTVVRIQRVERRGWGGTLENPARLRHDRSCDGLRPPCPEDRPWSLLPTRHPKASATV